MKLADQLNEQLRRAADLLHKRDHGVPGAVAFEHEGVELVLQWRKSESSWLFLVGQRGADPQPLAGASLAVRRLAAARIPDMFNNVAANAIDRDAELLDAVGRLTRWLDKEEGR